MSNSYVDNLRKKCEPIFRAYPVLFAYLYGSKAAGNATPLSDTDMALVCERDMSLREQLRLEMTMAAELTTSTGESCDVRVINNAPLTVKGPVVQTGILLYAKDDAKRIDFEATTRSLFFDFLPVIKLHRDAYLKTQRNFLREQGYRDRS